MKSIKKIAFIAIAVLMICLLCGAKSSSTKTCFKSGCKNKCAPGSSYCYIHKSHSNVKKDSRWETKKSNSSKSTKKSSGSSKSGKRKITKKSYYTDDMPDCDDYDNWGEFMDDWDGNMPDGSDASDYWDNW